jgi:hypothetical protein
VEPDRVERGHAFAPPDLLEGRSQFIPTVRLEQELGAPAFQVVMTPSSVWLMIA